MAKRWRSRPTASSALPARRLTPGLAWLGIVCYTLQIYFDFSGYSDMAIGLGRMFGFEFLENFNYPYLARSASRSSGGAGTSRFRPGSATTSTSRSAAIARPGAHLSQSGRRVLPVRAVARGELDLHRLGTAPRGCSWSRSGWGWGVVWIKLGLPCVTSTSC